MPFPVPSDAEIESLYALCDTPPDVRAHSQAVAACALHIAEQSGVPLDHGLLRAAALLHDMYRAVGREHPQKAAQKLDASGYPLLADIIAHHHDLGSTPSPEAEILYLADKLTQGTFPVTLEARFARSKAKCSTPQALAAWQSRYTVALALERKYIRGMNQPQQAVMVNIFMPCELMHAMGLTPMFPEGLSVYVACTACQHVFAERAETSGIPESFCSYHKTMIGMAESGVLPKPLLIAGTTLACDANQLSFRHLAAHYPAPLTLIDVPAREDDAAVAYVADQLRELARTLETLTGRKLDEAKLRESMACANRTLALMREYADLRAEVSQDTTMTGELCSLIATHCLLGHADGENYVRELIETAKRAPRRETTRRKRIFFIHTLPNWQDSMIRMLETENRCELVGCDITFDSLMPLDPDKPFESMARRLLANVNGGRSTRRIDNAIAWAKKLNADGVIVFCHWGCKQTMGLSTLAKRRLEEAGLPTLVLDGDGCDSRNVADGQMVTRVGAFLEQLEGMDA